MQECRNDGPIHGELFALGKSTCYLCVSMSYIYKYIAHTEPIPGAHAWEGRWVMVPAILDSDSGGIISSSSSHLAWWPMIIHYLKPIWIYLRVSINGDIPTWIVYNGKTFFNRWFRSTPSLGNPHLDIYFGIYWCLGYLDIAWDDIRINLAFTRYFDVCQGTRLHLNLFCGIGGSITRTTT